MSSATTAAAVNGDRAPGTNSPATVAEQAGTSDPAARVIPGRVRIDRYGLDLGPWLHLADERARLARPSFAHIDVVPQGAAPDTIVFWDNRSVQHYAASDYYPDVRVMERASIVGTRPA